MIVLVVEMKVRRCSGDLDRFDFMRSNCRGTIGVPPLDIFLSVIDRGTIDQD